MKCDEAQELLNPLIDNELPANEATAVSAHLQQCEECRQELSKIDELRNLLATVPAYPVPDSLAAQVAEGYVKLKRKRPRAHRWKRTVTLIATHGLATLAGVALVMGVGYFQDKRKMSTDDVVAVHVRSLMQQNLAQVTSEDSHTVKPWFAGKLEYAPPVTNLKSEGFPLVGARVDRLSDQKVAVLVYARRKHWINLFVSVTSTGTQLAEYAHWNRNGYNVVSAQQGGFVYRAVSDLSAAELEKFLRLIVSR